MSLQPWGRAGAAVRSGGDGHVSFMSLAGNIYVVLMIVTRVNKTFAGFSRSSVMSYFHVPLCFFVSNVFFGSCRNFSNFFLHGVGGLLVPFAFFCIKTFLLGCIM